MKNILKVLFIISFSVIQLSAYTNKNSLTKKNEQKQSSKIKSKTKKPEYYRGHSYGLQNYPGKTIDAGINTGMLSTNSASYMGNDISF